MPAVARIAFQNVGPSGSLYAAIRARIARLGKVYDRIATCRVVIERSPVRRITGEQYLCRVDLALPGQQIHIGREPENAASDPLQAIAAAFDAAEAALAGFIERREQALLAQPVV